MLSSTLRPLSSIASAIAHSTQSILPSVTATVRTFSSLSKANHHDTHICPKEFDDVVRRLRSFFHDKGFVEVHTQSRLSILAACEDPFTIATYNYSGQTWPLPQTGQMWLEHELLKNPDVPGLFCLSTSYRDEPNPIPGRHDKIFPMFEFEQHGGITEMLELEAELLNHLGFPEDEYGFPLKTYREICDRYKVDDMDLTHAHEMRLKEEFGAVFFLTEFPECTSPFWNMARLPRAWAGDEPDSKKVDVIINGIETIGSAERSCDKDDMLRRFNTISDGKYANILFERFGRERVMNEMYEFLSYDFFERSGGGIGVTRLIKGMKANGLLLAEQAKNDAIDDKGHFLL
jgi:aspartyl/asparaginyl-tRNA synthetase